MASAPPAHTEFDAGEMGCGELVLELKLRIGRIPAGAVLKVRALDPAAPEDIPSWCGMTRHVLVKSSHPDYWIQRRLQE